MLMFVVEATFSLSEEKILLATFQFLQWCYQDSFM